MFYQSFHVNRFSLNNVTLNTVIKTERPSRGETMMVMMFRFPKKNINKIREEIHAGAICLVLFGTVFHSFSFSQNNFPSTRCDALAFFMRGNCQPSNSSDFSRLPSSVTVCVCLCVCDIGIISVRFHGLVCVGCCSWQSLRVYFIQCKQSIFLYFTFDWTINKQYYYKSCLDLFISRTVRIFCRLKLQSKFYQVSLAGDFVGKIC